MNKRIVTVGIAALLLGGIVGYGVAQAPPKADDEGQATLKLADLPAAVREAVATLAQASDVKQVSIETSRGMKVYEIAYQAAGDISGEAEISEMGDVLEVDRKSVV